MVNRSGPARLAGPSTEWHFAQASRCSLLNSSRPRTAFPSWPIAKSRYSRIWRAGSAAAAWMEPINAGARSKRRTALLHIILGDCLSELTAPLPALLLIKGSTCRSTGFHLLCAAMTTDMFLSKRVGAMNRALYYTLLFLLIAIAAGALGFWALAGTLAWLARICFLLFLALFIISLVQRKRL